jgi:hypothetical protein
MTIESSNLGPGDIFRKGGTKIKISKNIFSTKHIKWIILENEILRETRWKYFQIDSRQQQKVVKKKCNKYSNFLSFLNF